ncbi:hypothetical protein RCL1_006082 [Eukaryota sp. TZLM3-RCL]
MQAGDKRLGVLDTPDAKRPRLSDPSSFNPEDFVFPKLLPAWDSYTPDDKKLALQQYINNLRILQTTLPSLQDPMMVTSYQQPVLHMPPTPIPQSVHKTPSKLKTPSKPTPSKKKAATSAARPKRAPGAVPTPIQAPVRPPTLIPIPIPDSHARPGGKRPSTDMNMQTCVTIVCDLINDPKGGHLFASPVDPNTCGAPDYYERIHNPMDLGTVRSRVLNGYYRSVEEFDSDVRLTFDNSLTFNPKDHPIHTVASHMKSTYEAMFARSFPTAVPTVTRDDVAVSRPPVQSTVPSPAPNVVVPTSQIQSVPLPSPAPIKPVAPAVRELTHEERRALRDDIMKLNEDDKDEVINILSELQDDSNSDDEMEVELDKLPPQVLFKLHEFVQSRIKDLDGGRFSDDDL